MNDSLFHGVLDDGHVVQWTAAHGALHPHPRAWTVGRTLSGRPELMISGLDKETSHALLDAFVEIDMVTPLVPDTTVGRMTIVDAEPGFALGALATFPTPELRVYQLVWAEHDDLDSDRDQTVYPRGATILNDPYGDR